MDEPGRRGVASVVPHDTAQGFFHPHGGLLSARRDFPHARVAAVGEPLQIGPEDEIGAFQVGLYALSRQKAHGLIHHVKEGPNLLFLVKR